MCGCHFVTDFLTSYLVAFPLSLSRGVVDGTEGRVGSRFISYREKYTHTGSRKDSHRGIDEDEEEDVDVDRDDGGFVCYLPNRSLFSLFTPKQDNVERIRKSKSRMIPYREFNNRSLVSSVASIVAGATLMWWWQQQQQRRRRAVNSGSGSSSSSNGSNSTDNKYMLPSTLSSSPYHRQARLALQLALRAGRNMHPYCDKAGTADQHDDLGISTKSKPEDFYTRIDVENETLVVQGIKNAFPRDDIIGEESVGTGGIPPLTDNPTWIIDPIDGTTNFASGLPLTCVSIGYCVDSVPVMGVVYAPMTDEVFVAVKGHGVFRNGVPIHRLPQTNEKQLADAVICFEFGYSREPAQVARMVDVVQRILNHGCRATRQLGSGVLDLCYVATGRLDAVYAGVAGEG